ncbi:hypothetical protein AVEN_272269-1 [Araneus ventricosus]|uniref:Uncharacterized protein n=1 Tax=Araneus ventricosus TaxID=182803 RepID=A0A4Y2SQF7_ARAVE|nr:hypothetical protein AVEN_272269-1 [Araneus ventricosus]
MILRDGYKSSARVCVESVGEEENGWKSVWDFEPSQIMVVKANIGASVNDLPNLSTRMGGEKNKLFEPNGIAFTSRECPS